MWYIIPHTKTKIIRHVHAAHGHTRKLLGGDVSNRNSLGSNNEMFVYQLNYMTEHEVVYELPLNRLDR